MAYHEPREIESLTVPASRDITLGMYLGGPLRVERREECARWQGEDRRHGELFLNWGGGAPYEVRSWTLSKHPSQLLNLQVSRELVARTAEEVVGVDLTRLELIGRTGFQDPLLTQVALALWRELEQSAPASKLYAQATAQFLAVHLLLRYTSCNNDPRRAPPAPVGLTERQIKHVIDFIEAHLGEGLSLDTVAEQVGFSPFHFARLFKRTMGVSLHQFVLRQRITCAQRLLVESELPLAQVAGECGFAHQSHLTRVFKQQVGHTPRAFRRGRAL